MKRFCWPFLLYRNKESSIFTVNMSSLDKVIVKLLIDSKINFFF